MSLYDWEEMAADGTGYEYDEPSLSRIALHFDTGHSCGDCGSEFAEANGIPSSCAFCHRRGSEYPLTQHPEKNVEAIKAVARRRKSARQKRANQENE